MLTPSAKPKISEQINLLNSKTKSKTKQHDLTEEFPVASWIQIHTSSVSWTNSQTYNCTIHLNFHVHAEAWHSPISSTLPSFSATVIYGLEKEELINAESTQFFSWDERQSSSKQHHKPFLFPLLHSEETFFVKKSVSLPLHLAF